MEVDSRKGEAKADFKHQDILIEVNAVFLHHPSLFTQTQEVLNKAIVSISELRTDVEEIKWENMRRSVGMCVNLYCHALADIRYSDAWCIPPGDYHVYGTASKACRHATARTFPNRRTI